jgi:3-dehydroquinate synthase
MKEISVVGKEGTSTILVGERFIRLADILQDRRSVIVTDSAVMDLYGKEFPDTPVIVIGRGENAKTLDTIHEIYRRLVEMEADRTTCIVGVGGGIVCDVTGFAASTFLRGLPFGFAPTTLLAQVDAGVGGKNGVNFRGYKNLIGTFRQPEFVLCDMEMLRSLPATEISCGLAEIVKHAVIADPKMFEYLEREWENALNLDPIVIEKLVHDSVIIKAGVVSRDETERGERRVLNFGHTIGHAIENVCLLSHGEAVSIGMAAAARFAEHLGMFPKSEVNRLISLLKRLKLPTSVPSADWDSVQDAIRRDKKREAEAIHFVLPTAIGRVVVRSIPLAEILTLLPSIR